MQKMSEHSLRRLLSAGLLGHENRTSHAWCFTYICTIKSSQHCGPCYRRSGKVHGVQWFRVHGHRRTLSLILRILYSGREDWRQSGTPSNKHVTTAISPVPRIPHFKWSVDKRLVLHKILQMLLGVEEVEMPSLAIWVHTSLYSTW